MRVEEIITGLREVIEGKINEVAIRNFLIVLSGRMGADILYQAGRRYGKLLGYKNKIKSIGDLLETLKEYFSSEVIIIPEDKKVYVLVRETLSSKGFGKLGIKVCYFEAGLISGLFSYFLRKSVGVVEKKCKVEGKDYCEFEIIL